MTNWKYTDATNTVAFRTLDNGGMESMLTSALPEGVAPEPADLPPPPTVQDELNALDAANTLTQRNLREFILLTTEAIKVATNNAVDLSLIPGVAKVVSVEGQAVALRARL